MGDFPEMPGRPADTGVSPLRVEDDRLLRGEGSYIADIRLPGMVDVAIVRSTLPHARIDVNLDAARVAEDVITGVAAADLVGLRPLPNFANPARPTHVAALAREKVRYVGSPIAAVVACDRYSAEDAAELVQIDYEPLMPVMCVDDALSPDSVRLYDDWPDNRFVSVSAVDGVTDRDFAEAERIVRGEFRMGRQTAVPIEPRGAIAEFRSGRLTLWTSTQIPHWLRTLIPLVLPISERNVRVVAPDVGGSFGVKWHIYPEELLVCWLAMNLRRPVRYIEARDEHMVATVHARDSQVAIEAAIDRNGLIQAIRGEILQDIGSGETYPIGTGPSFTCQGSLPGAYKIARMSVGVVGVVTNKTPSGAYRGYGAPEATFAMERLVDRCAAEVGVDPVELRRAMLIAPSDLPFETAAGSVLDSGSFTEAFESVVQKGRVAHRRWQSNLRNDSTVRVGVGFATFVEGIAGSAYGDTGKWAPHETVSLSFEPDGGVTVSSGLSSTGQGVETMLATLTAERLQIPIDLVRVVIGDTDATPYGLGGWGSRSTYFAGMTLARAADELIDKGASIAAEVLEAAASDVVLGPTGFHVTGTTARTVSWCEVAEIAYLHIMNLPEGLEPGLTASATHRLTNIDYQPRADGRMNACPSYANGSVAAVVKVDVGTGLVDVLEYIVDHDCGRIINPQIVDGQIHGGVAQGIGGVLLEELPYADDGQPLATTLMDYLMPAATTIPRLIVGHFESPPPNNPIGAKGAGEAGVIGAAPAIVAAIEDAVGEFGVDWIDEVPISPGEVRERIRLGPTRV